MASFDDESDYYDILVLGRTGQGKSTTANKLLQVGDEGSVLVDHEAEQDNCTDGGVAATRFQTGDGMDSVTKDCKLISNESSKIRVLDTPGFADTRATKELGVFRSNLQTFRSILRAQDVNDLAFCRVLYFLPLRGPPERADGILQEEIKLMHGYLGEEVFKIMVIVATNMKRRNRRQEEFDEEDIERTQKVFMKAFEIITDTEGDKEKILERCPPVVYLPFNEPNIINKVVGAQVLYEEPLKTPIIVDVTSTKKPDQLIHKARMRNKGRKLQFRDRCVKCSAKLIYENTISRGRIPVRVVVNEGGESEATIPYSESKCHAVLLPRYSKVQKFFGGVAHIATMGVFATIGKVRGKKLWPGFMDNEEYCDGCSGPPTANGCMKVGETFTIETEDLKQREYIEIRHSTVLDSVKIVETSV